MVAITHYIAFFGLWAASLVAADDPKFSVDICPWFYLRQSGGDSASKYEIVSACSTGDGDSKTYHTSSIDLNNCIVNDEGDLKPLLSTKPAPGDFTKTCENCGLVLHTDDNNNWNVGLRCNCVLTDKQKGPHMTTCDLNDALWINNGTLSCFGTNGNAITNPSDSDPKILPMQNTTTATSTVTNNSTVTSTATETVTASNTIVSTAAADKAVSTVTSACESPSEASTVTKVRKVTKTTSVMVTTQVTSTFTLAVTMTPPQSIGGVDLQTTTDVRASFHTK